MTMLGPISTLRRYRDEAFNADFLSGVAPEGMVHTRASTATYWDADGVLRTAAADEPRFEYDPVTRKPLGLLMEQPSTNRILRSSFSDGVVGASGSSAVSDLKWGRGLPKTGAHLSSPETGNVTVYKSTSTVEGVTETFSFFVKMDDGLPPVIGSTSVASSDFFITVAAGVPTAYGAIDCGNGIYRAWGRITHAITSPARSCGIVKSSNQSKRGFSVTGYQINEGNYPSSYVETLGSAVTRARDVPSLSAPWYNGAVGGTMLVEYQLLDYIDIGTLYFLTFSDGSQANRLRFLGVPTTKSIRSQLILGGATAQDVRTTVAAAYDGQVPVRQGLSFDQSGALARTNGVTMGADLATPSVLPGLNTMTFFESGAFRMYLRLARYYAKRADVTTLTTR